MRVPLVESTNYQRIKVTKHFMDGFSYEYVKIDDKRLSGREADIGLHFQNVDFEKLLIHTI